MDCWTILGTEKTADKEIIRKAYYAKLPLYHPEDDPVGFQKLKDAYDEALAWEDTPAPEQEDTSDVGLWLARVAAVYADFPQRINIAGWEALLDDPVVISLATNLEAGYRLLVFLLENYRLPHKVFALLESTFNWKENRGELLESFSSNFIDYLLDQAFNEGLRYELFDCESGKDYDRFIENYFALHYALIPPLEMEKVPDLIRETDAMGIEHPDYTLQKIKCCLYEDDLEPCPALLEPLLKSFPDGRTWYAAAHVALRQERFDEAITWLERCLEVDGTEYSYSARLLIGDCLAGREKYEEALARYEELRRDAPASDELFHRIRQTHVQLAEALKARLPDLDDEAKLAYVDHCLATDMYEECAGVASSIDPAGLDRLKYCRSMGTLYGGLKNMEESARYFDEALVLARAAQAVLPVTPFLAEALRPAETDPAVTALSELLSDYGWAYEENDEFDKALKLFEESIEVDGAFMRSHNRKAYTLNKLERYQDALACCEKVLEKAPYMSALLSKAKALLGLGDHTGALAVAEDALSVALYQEAFRIKLECFYELEKYEEALALTEFLREKDAISTEILETEMRTLTKLEKHEEAEKVQEEILDKDPGNFAALAHRSGTCFQNGDYDLALAALDQADHKKVKRSVLAYAYTDLLTKMRKFDQARQYLIALGRSQDKSVDAIELCYRLALLAEQASIQEGAEEEGPGPEGLLAAIAHYKGMLEIDPEHPFANRKISARYFDLKDYENSLLHIMRQMEISKKLNDDFLYGDYMNMALTYNKMGKDLVEEKEVMEEALERFPQDEHINNYIGAWYVEHDDHEAARPYFQTALDYGNNDPNFWSNITQNLCVLGKYEEGIDIAARAAAAHPDTAYFLYRQAWFNQLAGRFQEAAALFEQWGESVTDTGFKQEAQTKIGDCHACMGEYQKALETYLQALDTDAKNAVNLRLKTGYIHELLENDKQAARFYRSVLFGKRGDDARHRLAMLYWRRGRKIRCWLATAALAFYTRRRGKDGDYFLIGQMYKVQGKHQKAIKCFNRKIEDTKFCSSLWKTGCSESWYELAGIHRSLGNEEEARVCEEKAREISACRFDCGAGEFFS